MISPLHAVEEAFARTRVTLFEPFDFGRYLLIGICMWLYQLGSFRGSGASSYGGPSWNADMPMPDVGADDLDALFGQLDVVLPAAAAVVGIGLVVALAIWTLVLFVQTRGAFLVMDGLVRQRGAVREPWAAYAPEAWALFRFRMLVGPGGALAVLAIVVGTAGAVWSTWDASVGPTALHIGLLVLASLTGGAVSVVLGLTELVVDEFAIPLMYARRIGVVQALSDLWGFVRETPADFLVYVGVRIAIGLGAAVVTGFVSCFSCGSVMFPVIGTLILLPILVGVRNLSICFVSQLSDDLTASLASPTSARTPG